MTEWYITDVCVVETDTVLYVVDKDGVIVGRWRDLSEAIAWTLTQKREAGDRLRVEVTL